MTLPHRLARALACALMLCTVGSVPAMAQAPQVLDTCGAADLPLGPGGRLFISRNGNLCTNATGGSGGGGQTGSVTAPGTAGTQAQAVQGVPGGVPQRVEPAQPDTVDTYAITGTGPTQGVRLAGYGSVLADLSGTVNLTGSIQFSSDSTDGVDGAWQEGFGFIPGNAATVAPTNTLNASTKTRLYRADGVWVRFNATAFTSGPATLKLTRKAMPVGERAVFIGGGSTTLRSAGTPRSATVGTTAVTLMAANTNRQGWKIKNDTTGDIWINFDATATATAGAGNIKIPANSYLASEPSFVETGAMSAIGSAAGLAITAREH